MPTIDDAALFTLIAQECEIGAERLSEVPRDATFLDSKGAAWNRGSDSPQFPKTHRIFAIFNLSGSEDVWIYGVPKGEKFPADAFIRWIIQRTGTPMQTPQGPGVTVSCVITHMGAEAFKREIGDKLWDAWVEATKARDTRNAAEALQGALELIADGDPAAADARAFAKATLIDLGLTDDDPPAPPPNGSASTTHTEGSAHG
jgi:hypothetical protein